MPLDEEIPHCVTQMIDPRKIHAQTYQLHTACFVLHVVVTLANQQHQQARDVVRRKLRLHFDASRCHAVATIAREMAHSHCVGLRLLYIGTFGFEMGILEDQSQDLKGRRLVWE
jgi:hypothetical protein